MPLKKRHLRQLIHEINQTPQPKPDGKLHLRGADGDPQCGANGKTTHNIFAINCPQCAGPI